MATWPGCRNKVQLLLRALSSTKQANAKESVHVLSSVGEHPLPDDALLSRYRNHTANQQTGNYTDCFAVDVPRTVSLEQFVFAFYTTPVFKLERIILAALASRPSSDADARQLSKNETETFAAWTVEDRTSDQLLMCDFRGRTRSWFKVSKQDAPELPGTRLYFGSAVIRKNDKHRLSFGVLLSFHRVYSRVLLRAAARRVAKERA